MTFRLGWPRRNSLKCIVDLRNFLIVLIIFQFVVDDNNADDVLLFLMLLLYTFDNSKEIHVQHLE